MQESSIQLEQCGDIIYTLRAKLSYKPEILLSEEEEVIGMSAVFFLLFLFRVCSKLLGFWVTLGEK